MSGVGQPRNPDFKKEILDFVSKLFKAGDNRLKKEVYRLPFSSLFEVRGTICNLLIGEKQPLFPLMVSYIEDCLRKTGFQLSQYELKTSDGCVWYDASCKLSLKKARIVLLVAQNSCLARKDLDFKQCSEGHSVKQQDPEKAKIAW